MSQSISFLLPFDSHFLSKSDYAVDIFHKAVTEGRMVCPLKKDTALPMMFIEDCLRSVTDYLNVDSDQLKLRTYNVNAMSFCPEELAEEVKKYFPKFEMIYRPDRRQEIGKYGMSFTVANFCGTM